MRTRKQPSPGNRDQLEAQATGASIEAQSAPLGPERIEALRKADQLRSAADTYNYLFSTELKAPE